MKSRIDFQTIKPHLVAIALFVIASSVSTLFRGEDVASRRYDAYAGAAQELKNLKQKQAVCPWTDRMFGGMPTF